MCLSNEMKRDGRQKKKKMKEAQGGLLGRFGVVPTLLLINNNNNNNNNNCNYNNNNNY